MDVWVSCSSCIFVNIHLWAWKAAAGCFDFGWDKMGFFTLDMSNGPRYLFVLPLTYSKFCYFTLQGTIWNDAGIRGISCDVLRSGLGSVGKGGDADVDIVH